MFDTINRSSSSSSVSINVEQAGVHEAATLLRDMERSVINKIKVNNNKYEAAAFVMQGMLGAQLGITLMLNDERINVKSESSYYDERSLRECITEISDKIAGEIASRVIQSSIMDISHELARSIRI